MILNGYLTEDYSEAGRLPRHESHDHKNQASLTSIQKGSQSGDNSEQRRTHFPYQTTLLRRLCTEAIKISLALLTTVQLHLNYAQSQDQRRSNFQNVPRKIGSAKTAKSCVLYRIGQS